MFYILTNKLHVEIDSLHVDELCNYLLIICCLFTGHMVKCRKYKTNFYLINGLFWIQMEVKQT